MIFSYTTFDSFSDIKESELKKRLENTGIIQTISNQPHVIKTKSNFYKALNDDKKIKYIESTFLKDNKKVTIPIRIDSSTFIDQIRTKEELPEEIERNVRIRIISPVLENMRYKWTGEYKGEIIYFYLNDKDFKKSIESNEISFSHGDLIECDLSIRKKINETGEIEITSYAVSVVYKRISSDNNIVETRHGKKKKRIENELQSQNGLGF